MALWPWNGSLIFRLLETYCILELKPWVQGTRRLRKLLLDSNIKNMLTFYSSRFDLANTDHVICCMDSTTANRNFPFVTMDTSWLWGWKENGGIFCFCDPVSSPDIPWWVTIRYNLSVVKLLTSLISTKG